MAGMYDYLIWRGDLDSRRDGWNGVDALIMATVCYNDLPMGEADEMTLKQAAERMPPCPEDAGKNEKQRRRLLTDAAGTARFSRMLLRSQTGVVDGARSMQFSALTAESDEGTFVCFRGTDSTIVGWRENFSMSFETPVPAQTAAAEYLERAAGRAAGPIRVVGHSKGGNLALYAACHVPPEVQRHITGVYSFDGPGLDEESVNSEGYMRLQGMIHSFIPQGSVVGLLLAYHPDFTVVRSTGLGIYQHDPFTWQIAGKNFERAPQLSRGSELIDRSLHSWLKTCTPQERRVFFDTLFDAMEAGDARKIGDVKKNLNAVVSAFMQIDPAKGRLIGRMAGSLLGTAVDSLKEMLLGPPGASGNGDTAPD